MSDKELTSLIEKMLTPFLKDKDLEIIDIIIKQKGLIRNIEILADKIDGHIGVDECVYLNRSLCDKIDEELIFPDDNYVVEVSSPGMDRPLKTKKDYSRVLGKKIILFLTEKVEGKGQYTAIVKEVADDFIVIDVNNLQIKIPYGKIVKGVLDF